MTCITKAIATSRCCNALEAIKEFQLMHVDHVANAIPTNTCKSCNPAKKLFASNGIQNYTAPIRRLFDRMSRN